MKYPILAAALLCAAAVPTAATAMTIDADERELYDDSIQCMAFFGIMAGLTTEEADGDPAMRQSAAKFLAVATVLADEDDTQIRADLDSQMKMFGLLTKNPDDPDNIKRVRDIGESCKFMETLVDAMIDGSS